MSQVRKGHAAYVGNPGTPVSEWKEIGYVSEDGLAEGPYQTEAADTLHEVRYGSAAFSWPRRSGKNTLRRLLNEVDAGTRALRNQQIINQMFGYLDHWGFDLSTPRPAPRTKSDLIWGPDVPVSLKKVSIR